MKIWGSKNAFIFNISIFSGRKVNLVGTFERVKSKILRSFRKCNETLKVVIFTRNQFKKGG